NAPFTATLLARRSNDLAVAGAVGTHGHAHDRAEERLLSAAHFTCALASRAGAHVRARLRTGAFAVVARVQQLDSDGLLHSRRDFLERESEADANVGTGARLGCAASPTEQIVETAHSTEVAH